MNKDYDITTDRLHKAYKDIDRHANTLIVHNGKKESSQNESLASNDGNTTSGNTQYHTVRKGDTLGKIAKNYHTSVSSLCRLNNISSTSILRVGKRLRVQ
ncbi:MAG: LysM peptidoglycan-binding domain-containing protein [Bacteroidales bacterium]|nr:LysM peptidoglycan-binding domain-containing protein [Bacteroidales bacterium]MBR6991311.1 LysM peptidoglycan-binding domain-containing protein [Bacteroidales bacterium]